MPQLCACLKIRDTPPILERKWWFTSNFSGILFEDTPIHSSRAKAWLLGPAPIRWLDTTAPAMGSPKKPWTLFTGCGNMANVGKTIPQTTPLGIVYTIYKNGDLGDGLLYGIVSPCFTHIIGIYRTLQDTSGFYRFFLEPQSWRRLEHLWTIWWPLFTLTGCIAEPLESRSQKRKSGLNLPHCCLSE